MKTARGILDSNETDPGPLHWITKKAAVKAMQEYADQEIVNYKARLIKVIEAKEIQVDPMFYLAYRDVIKLINNV